MLSVGAYSTKFQNLEKERLRQLKEREKAKRGKAQLYSKQTAQRQKALEEKKRAMAIAEEDRRRKALEDRRESQKEATKRFKSALGRIRATSKGQVQPISKDRTTSIDFYLPDKANPNKGPNISNQAQLNRPFNDEQQERVAFGKEVEIKMKPKNGFHHPPHINGLQRRTPSLDDVLRQVKGERNPSPDSGTTQYSQGRIHVHQTVPGMFGAAQQNKLIGSLGGPGRSASDPSLNVTASSHQGKQPPPPSVQSANNHNHVAINKFDDTHTLSSQATHNLHRNASIDNIVFRHVVATEATQQPHPSVSKMEEDLHVMSPETPDSSSSGLPSDSSSDGVVSPDLHDSLEFSGSGITFTVGDTQLQNKTDQFARKDSSNANMSAVRDNNDTSARSDSNTNSIKSRTSSGQGSVQQAKRHQPIYVCEVDDSSSNDSVEECRARAGPRPTPPRDRRHRKHHNSAASSDNPIETSTPIASMSTNTYTEPSIAQQQSQSAVPADSSDLDVEVKPKSKIVGILKKSGSSALNSRVPSGNSMAESSYANSTVEGQGSEALLGSGHDYCDGKTEPKKKVRFVDQVELSGVDIPVKKKSEIGFIDSARIELWKRVLPNGVSTHYLPNSAFTPKMKVSLLSKASVSQGISGPPLKPHPSSPPNGITVHVPVVTADESPGTSPSPRQITPVQSIPEDPPSNIPDPTNEKLPVNVSSTVETLPVTTQATKESVQSDATIGDIDPLTLQVNKQIPLDKTPTDADINHLWDQIQNALQDNQKISIPPQVFNFRIQPDKLNYQPYENSSAGSVTSQTSTLPLRDEQRGHSTVSGTTRRNPTVERTHSKSGDASVPQRQGYQRQTNPSRPMRCQQIGTHQQTQLLGRRGHSYTATYPVSNRQDHTLFSTRTHPNVQTSSVEPELVGKATVNNFGRRTPTALSLEEQRLMLSIETLNQQIKDHMARPPGISQFESPKSPDPPDFTPEYYPHPPPSPTPPQRHRSISTHPHNHTHSYGTVSGRSRGYSDLPKTRVRRNPQTVALAATVNAQLANSSRTHSRVPTYRQPLYN